MAGANLVEIGVLEEIAHLDERQEIVRKIIGPGNQYCLECPTWTQKGYNQLYPPVNPLAEEKGRDEREGAAPKKLFLERRVWEY